MRERRATRRLSEWAKRRRGEEEKIINIEIMAEENDFLMKEAQILKALKTVFDPEIPVNVYDLGLIYEIAVDENKVARITMTLTAPNCPMADDLIADVRNMVGSITGVKDVDITLTFDPPWDKSMMSEEAKLELGFL